MGEEHLGGLEGLEVLRRTLVGLRPGGRADHGELGVGDAAGEEVCADGLAVGVLIDAEALGEEHARGVVVGALDEVEALAVRRVGVEDRVAFLDVVDDAVAVDAGEALPVVVHALRRREVQGGVSGAQLSDRVGDEGVDAAAPGRGGLERVEEFADRVHG